jgi:D-alanyl-D-alanine carboxypeptidase
MGVPPVLPGRPPSRPGEDPEREKGPEELNRGYGGAPWLTALVHFTAFLAVIAGSFAAVRMFINAANGQGWWPYALLLAVLVAVPVGLWMPRRHRREAGRGHGASLPPGRGVVWLRRHRLPLIALAVVAAMGAGLLAASPWQRSGPAPPAVESALTSVIDAGAPGVVAQVWGGRSWAEAKGFANLRQRVPMRPDDRFRIASLTKTYVAAVLLQLAAEGRLGLDDPVARYLPGLLRDGGQITVRQLLNHTSGLADSGELAAVQQAGQNGGAVPASEQVRLANAEPRSFAPGARWNYSNTGYLVAGLLIERLTGHDLGQVLAARLFGPLHLTATTFEPQPGIPAGIAHGYWAGYGIPAVDATESVGGGAWAAGAIVSSARDVARFYAALLSGRVVPVSLLAQMRSTIKTTHWGYGDAYGLGLARFDLACGPAWGHGGNLFTYTAIAEAAPDGHRGAVVLVNGFTGTPGPNDRVFTAMKHAADAAYCHR